jgi:hypothetical protein
MDWMSWLVRVACHCCHRQANANAEGRGWTKRGQPTANRQARNARANIPGTIEIEKQALLPEAVFHHNV